MDVAYLAPAAVPAEHPRRDRVSRRARGRRRTSTYVEDMPATYLSGPTGCSATLAGECSPTRTHDHSQHPNTRPPPRSPPTSSRPSRRSVGATACRWSATRRSTDTTRCASTCRSPARAPLFPFLRLGGTWRPFFSGDRVVSGWTRRAGTRCGSTSPRPPTPSVDPGRCDSGCLRSRPAQRSSMSSWSRPRRPRRHRRPSRSRVERLPVSSCPMPRTSSATGPRPFQRPVGSRSPPCSLHRRVRRPPRCSCTRMGSTTSASERIRSGQGHNPSGLCP